MKPNVLLICGSLNQTTIMHQIGRQLEECHVYYTPFYANGFLGLLSKLGVTNFTILGGRHRRDTENYLKTHQLPVDFGGKSRHYDLVITGTDLIIQRNLRGTRILLVQEGMLEPEGWRYHLTRALRLPRFFANTAATGLSDAYHRFCVASNGYREVFIRKGVNPAKIVVTGIPNFDNAVSYLNNDFPLRGYVLVATSATRETMRYHNRLNFLLKVKSHTNGKPVIFKLHPNENIPTATREIRQFFPEAPIYVEGNVHHMIANCDMLIAQNTSAIFTAVALGKPVISDLDTETLRKLLPLQNGGKSAERIAEVARQLLATPLHELEKQSVKPSLSPQWKLPPFF
ncbi:hypothetical protein [Anaerolinea sp.]|uniref:hypothetical protein n=1 Tax=Anaerolinea sp. TaxID=1872519 RepID=UPI002ACD5F2A|nr:hypothetical protein [Anaerolinea sp.]